MPCEGGALKPACEGANSAQIPGFAGSKTLGRASNLLSTCLVGAMFFFPRSIMLLVIVFVAVANKGTIFAWVTLQCGLQNMLSALLWLDGCLFSTHISADPAWA